MFKKIWLKCFSVVLLTLLLGALLPGVAEATFAGGDGSEGDPFYPHTDFRKIQEAVHLGQAPPELEWSRTFGGADWDRSSSVQQTKEGGFIITGGTDSFGASERVMSG